MPSLWTIFPISMGAIIGLKHSIKVMLWFMKLNNWFDVCSSGEVQKFIHVTLFDCCFKLSECSSTKLIRHLKIIQKCACSYHRQQFSLASTGMPLERQLTFHFYCKCQKKRNWCPHDVMHQLFESTTKIWNTRENFKVLCMTVQKLPLFPVQLMPWILPVIQIES